MHDWHFRHLSDRFPDRCPIRLAAPRASLPAPARRSARRGEPAVLQRGFAESPPVRFRRRVPPAGSAWRNPVPPPRHRRGALAESWSLPRRVLARHGASPVPLEIPPYPPHTPFAHDWDRLLHEQVHGDTLDEGLQESPQDLVELQDQVIMEVQ